MVASYSLRFQQGAVEDLGRVRAYDRSRIVDTIDSHLATRPLEETRRKKPLGGLKAPWQGVRPIWQLRVGEYRVFYDVDEEAGTVLVQAIRRKPAGRTTADIV
jgi:mRNA-degrading endonuclease RelE of RelBE toxin-antitoxin system